MYPRIVFELLCVYDGERMKDGRRGTGYYRGRIGMRDFVCNKLLKIFISTIFSIVCCRNLCPLIDYFFANRSLNKRHQHKWSFTFNILCALWSNSLIRVFFIRMFFFSFLKNIIHFRKAVNRCLTYRVKICRNLKIKMQQFWFFGFRWRDFHSANDSHSPYPTDTNSGDLTAAI